MDAHLAGLQAVVERSCGTPPLPDPVREKAKLMLLDTIGCILAGRLAPELVALEAAFASIETGMFRFPGGAPLTTQAATALGAIAATWDEGCEGLAYAHGRPALPVVGALLPLALARQARLDEVLTSLVAGYEVGARAGGWLRIRPGMHVDGNWPALGVAAAVSRLLGLSAEVTVIAMNIAACQLPASLYLPITTGDNARNTYIAHSAWLGLIAAFSAQAGITAPQQALLEYADRFAAADPKVPQAD
ncbi:MAG TPA: MmgE/PrpD family protein, partial [Burkholderiales bacterium]|nr:MmgE/PrpD family protein [Burkholderiales bacterium]